MNKLLPVRSSGETLGWAPWSELDIADMKLVTPWWVTASMHRIQPSAPFNVSCAYGEISNAISDAANSDPIFGSEDGGYRTAALLIAVAYQRSGFHPNAVSHGNGLYRLCPPNPRIPATMTVMPKEASLVALDLLRKSLEICKDRSIDERLGWFIEGHKSNDLKISPDSFQTSRVIFRYALGILLVNPPPGTTHDRA